MDWVSWIEREVAGCFDVEVTGDRMRSELYMYVMGKCVPHQLQHRPRSYSGRCTFRWDVLAPLGTQCHTSQYRGSSWVYKLVTHFMGHRT